MGKAEQIKQAIQTLESQRSLLGDEAVDAAIAAMRAQLKEELREKEVLGQLTGERKLVTVMFADVSGFTQLSENRDPEEVRALMNDCFDQLVPVIQKYEGTIDKFIGDEIMALFGAPKAHERHAELACNAALDLFEAIRQFNQRRGTNLGLHIGINAGLVIAGGIGSAGRQEYSVMGDAVNLADRLKGAATRGEVFVGSEVYELTEPVFHFNVLPPILLKGKKEPVRIYRLQARKETRGQGRQGAMRSDLIGRKAELRALQKALQAVQDGKGSRVAVIGEAGIGKSRLVTEARNTMGEAVIWVEGRALSYTRQHSYQPAVEILTKLIGTPSGMEGAQVKSLLLEELQRTLGEEGTALLPFLGRMMQLPLDEEEEISVKYLNADGLRKKIFSAFTAYLETRSRQVPIVAVWEDLHWADPSSLALIEYLLPFCDRYPLTMLLIFRPRKEERVWTLHEKSATRFGDGYKIIELEPLSSENSAHLIRNLIRMDSLSPEVEQLVFQKAEGNPFFVEELLRALLDKGLLFLDGQAIKVSAPLESIAIPGTLQGVIASRIDQLEAKEKNVLQTASVLGRIFERPLLGMLLSSVMEYAGLDHSLNQLIDRDMIRRRAGNGESAEVYIFKHAVTHDVAYNGLLLADRKKLHRLAGEIIEQFEEIEKSDYAENLAFHFERAEQQEKAVHYLGLAAGRVKKIHSNEEAIALYKRAIRQVRQLIGEDGSALEWRKRLAWLLENQADILELTGQYEAAVKTYLEAIDCLEERNRIDRSRLYRKNGKCHYHQAIGKFEAIQENFNKAENLLVGGEDKQTHEWKHEWIELQLERVFLYYWIDRADLMRFLTEEIRSSIEHHGNPDQRMRFYQNLVLRNFRLERFLASEATVEVGRQAFLASQQANDLRQQSFACFLYGFAGLWHNDFEKARRQMEMALEIAERIGDVVLQSRILTYLAVAHRRMLQLDQTETYALRSLELAQAASMPEYLGTANANLAWLAWKRGQPDKVEGYAKKVWTFWEKVPGIHAGLTMIWTVAWPLAALYCHQGNLPGCIEMLKNMIEPPRKQMEPELEEEMKATISCFEARETGGMHEQVEVVLELAEKYRYL